MSAAAVLAEKVRERGRKRVRRILWIVAAGVVLLALLALAWFSPILAVDRVDVRGAERLDAGAVADAVGEDVRGVSLPAALTRSGEVEARLIEEFPAIRELSLAPAGPRAVRVTLVERAPVAAIAEESGGYRVLDAEGVTIGQEDDVPEGVAEVSLTEDTADEAVAATLSVLASLPPDIAARVVQVGAETPQSIELTLDGDVTIRWGADEANARKAEVVAILLQGEPSVIDVTVPSRPATEE